MSVKASQQKQSTSQMPNAEACDGRMSVDRPSTSMLFTCSHEEGYSFQLESDEFLITSALEGCALQVFLAQIGGAGNAGS